MILTDLISMILRLAELAFAAIVLGITSHYLHVTKGVSAWNQGRFIYTDVVAGLSVVLAIIWLFPFSGSFIHWPADLFISIMWFVSFGLLVNWLNGSCGYVISQSHSTGTRRGCVANKRVTDTSSTGAERASTVAAACGRLISPSRS